MASAQVQHDGHVIGSLVAPYFSTLGGSCFSLHEPHPRTRLPQVVPKSLPLPVTETGHRFMRSSGGTSGGTDKGSRRILHFTSAFLRTAPNDLPNQYS